MAIALHHFDKPLPAVAAAAAVVRTEAATPDTLSLAARFKAANGREG